MQATLPAGPVRRPASAKRWLVRLAIAVLLLLPPVFSNDYVQYVVNLIVVYALVAVGFNVVLGYLGQLAFANAAFFGIGAYTCGISMVHLGLPFWAALVPTGIVSLAAGALVGLPALRLKGYYLAIVTLVLGELMRWSYIHGDVLTAGSSGLGIPPATAAGFTFGTEDEKYYLFLLVAAVMIWATNNIIRSRIGRSWVAIRENELATAALGMSPAVGKVTAFAWSGFVVGIAGALFAILIGRIAPESFNLHQLLLHFAIVMIGGLGSILGSILGAIVLTAAPEVLRNFPGMEEIVFSLLLIGVLLFMPRGLQGVLVGWFPRLRERLYRE
nr:branched-chain amino acid ABC transporter permease [Propylenella binzhouense]